MRRRVIERPESRLDVIEAALYIANDHPSAAERFLAAVEAAQLRLLEMPEIGSTRPSRRTELGEFRMWPVPEFPKYLVFYRTIPEGIEVLRVLRAQRNWQLLL